MKPAPLPLEHAQARLLALVPTLGIEHVDIEGAFGRYLVEPLLARRTQPAADLSAMDGYAVQSTNLAGPWRVAGESAAGSPFAGAVGAGEAIRISTGALLPCGADTVILQEDIERSGDRIMLTGTPPSPHDKHIRRRGMDFTNGSEVLAAGTRLGPAQVALAISAGHIHVAVRRKPRLAIIDSGDELAAPGRANAPHQIPASNGAMLRAMAQTLPCEARRLGPVADDLDALAAALERAHDADIIVTSGGASVGDHDLVRPALDAWGATIDFWRIAIKPGKPLLVATRDIGGRRQVILGLPGNPVSSHVTALLFMMPMLRAMLGAADPLPPRIRVPLAAPLKPGGSRREFLRAVWSGSDVAAQPIQDSAALASLAASNALIDRAAQADAAAVGDLVDLYLT